MRTPPVIRHVGVDQPHGPPRCIDCGYVLEGLSDVGQCPECGRGFNLSNPHTYSLKPPLVRWRLWLPGLLLSCGGSAIIMAVTLLWAGNWGAALWFAVPFAGGGLLGYRVRAGIFAIVLSCLALLITLIMTVVAMDYAGVFCGLALAGILLGPILVGTALGIALRAILKATRFSQRWHLPALLIVMIPLLAALIEGRPRQDRLIETISTSMTIAAPIESVWNSLMFYEEVTHEPPWILRVGLARPLSTTGSSRSAGDQKVCVYNKGHITKRIVEVREPALLSFDIVEQQIGYEHDVHLTGGSFALEAISSNQTKLTLQTQYRPLLNPRWCWRPFEGIAVHTLHDYVMEGIALRAQETDERPTLATAGGEHADRR